MYLLQAMFVTLHSARTLSYVFPYNNNLLYDPFAIKPNVKFAPPGRSRARSAVGVVSAAAVVFYIYILKTYVLDPPPVS